MRVAAATIALVGSGLLAGHALADTVPIPPVPLPVPTVTVPTLPPVLPPPTSPTLPTPAPAAPSPVPAPSAATPAVPTVQSVPAGSGAVPGGSSGGSSYSTASSSSASSAPRSDRPTVERFRFRSSRNWIATSGPKRRLVTTLTFGLPSAARVAFVVEQVSPLCKIADRFAVDGQAGLNRIRFPRAASRLQLEPGTYWITARTRTGRVVRRVPDFAPVVESLREIGMSTVTDLFSTYTGQRADLGPWVADAEINRDRDLRLQYLGGWGINSNLADPIYREMLRYRKLSDHPFVGSPETVQRLLTYIAGAH